jgi:hypothetical protein
MAKFLRHLFSVILILAPLPLILLVAEANAVNGESVYSNPLAHQIVEATKIVFNTPSKMTNRRASPYGI